MILEFNSNNDLIKNIVKKMYKGEKLSDLIGISGSMDFVIPDIDR